VSAFPAQFPLAADILGHEGTGVASIILTPAKSCGQEVMLNGGATYTAVDGLSSTLLCTPNGGQLVQVKLMGADYCIGAAVWY